MAIEGPLKLNVQIMRDSAPAIGPGKALVLEAIHRAGSISAAGRDLGMSYRRIWLLVESINASWCERAVDTRNGEGAKRGACLTPFGQELLARYRAMEQQMLQAAKGADFDWLIGAMASSSISTTMPPD
jgi:molybdate transport system regulatory protein